MYTYSIIITRNGQEIKKFLDFLPVLSIYFSIECQLLLEVKKKLTYEELAEKSGVSSRYIKEIENHGNIPSIEKLGQLIRALHISADPFFYPAAPSDNLDYQRLQVYLSQCTDDQITTILAIVEAYLRTYKNPMK